MALQEACPSDTESEEDLEAALELSLGGCVADSDDETTTNGAEPVNAPPLKRATLLPLGVSQATVHDGKEFDWPEEVRLCVAGFLPWQELVHNTRLSSAWRALEQEDAIWQVYFNAVWPRLARRKVAENEKSLAWRELFRIRWAEARRNEDAIEEDWLDFNAAQDLTAKPQPAHPQSLKTDTCHAIRRYKEDLLRLHGIIVPAVPDPEKSCIPNCRYRRVPTDGDVFVCLKCGKEHICQRGIACEGSLATSEDCFLVCPVSGHCYVKPDNHVAEEAADTVTNDWDPDLSISQQHGRWFEQGYYMSEDQARHFFRSESRSLSCCC
mmetsp:Transcript_138179/g.240398  ORF Transcript_138179/g.240398 Transcript_138179/m.240398 type:complete len:324 (-) Transcript_138179:119-1090(-)